MAQNVKVCCRYRPPSANERSDGSKRVVVVGEDHVSTKVMTDQDPAGGKNFIFDHVFDVDANQDAVYENTAKPLVAEIMRGFNCTVFAYGQTGSGKTHTMMGDPNSHKNKGIIPRLVEGIFDTIMDSEDNIEFTIKLSFLEIYNERIKDLLDPEKDNLKIREGSMGVYVEDMTAHYIASFEEVLEVMAHGNENRAMASTNMNETSSRSHSVFILTLGQTDRDTGSRRGAKLTLVDLAGSEKVLKTGAAGQTLKEAMHINKSLSALGNVINALTSHTSHIPYRDSKLTRLLTDSLGGNSKTCLIITASPMSSNAEETVSTLRFGARAKKIKNKPKINQEKSVAEYKRLLAERDRKLAAQAAMIQALEADVAALTAALEAVPAEHRKTPMPELRSSAMKQQLGRALLPSAQELAESQEDVDLPSPARSESPTQMEQQLEEQMEERDKPEHSEEADEDEDSGDEAAHARARPHPKPPTNGRADTTEGKTSEAEGKEVNGSVASTAHILEDLEEKNALREEIQELRRQLASTQHQKAELTKQLHLEQAAAKAAMEARHAEMDQQAKEVEARREKLVEQEAEAESRNFELELYKKKLAIQEKEHKLAMQNASAEKDEILRSLKKLQEEKAEADKAEADKAEASNNTGAVDLPSPPAKQISKMQKDMKKTQDDYSYLHRALKKKCDQYMHLQLIYQDTRDHSALLEKALKDVQKKLVNAKNKGDKQKIKDLENRLAESQEICEKLFESGLYWRQKRFLNTDKIRKPLFGGGGKGEKKSKSSTLRTASALDNLLATAPPTTHGGKKTVHHHPSGMNQFF